MPPTNRAIAVSRLVRTIRSFSPRTTPRSCGESTPRVYETRDLPSSSLRSFFSLRNRAPLHEEPEIPAVTPPPTCCSRVSVYASISIRPRRFFSSLSFTREVSFPSPEELTLRRISLVCLTLRFESTPFFNRPRPATLL